MKRALWAAVGLALAATGLAQLSKHKDWGKSAEAYFLTASEKDAWSRIQSDAEAEKFIADYWAKRDPNPATTANEFRDDVGRRIAAADEQFKMRNRRGSETARGRLLVVLGLPTRVASQRPQERAVDDTGGVTAPSIDTSARPGETAAAVMQTWTYTKDKFDPSLGIGEQRIRVNVDPQRGTDDIVSVGQVNQVIAKIAEKTVVNPAASAATAATTATTTTAPGAPSVAPVVPPAATGPSTDPPAAAPAPAAAAAAPPSAAPAATAPAAAAPATAPAAATAALPADVQATLAALGGKDAKPVGSFWSGEFRAVTGEPFYAMQFYVPADQATQPLKFGGIVWNEGNQTVASYWEDPTFTDVKSGPRTDKVYDRSIALPAGSYRGAFGLFPAAGGTALATASSNFKLESRAGEFGVSPLILANTLTPLTKRPAPTDPFVFGVEKPIKVEPKGDRRFAREDSLWYFYAVSNPVLPAGASAAAPAPAPATTPGATAAAPATPATPAVAEPKPRVMTRISVLRDGQPAFQPLTSPAELQLLGPGYYASGSEIPLASFEPGYYTFAIHVRDMNAAKESTAYKGIERKEEFVVLNADGSMPAKAAAKPKAPAKKG